MRTVPGNGRFTIALSELRMALRAVQNTQRADQIADRQEQEDEIGGAMRSEADQAATHAHARPRGRADAVDRGAWRTHAGRARLFGEFTRALVGERRRRDR